MLHGRWNATRPVQHLGQLYCYTSAFVLNHSSSAWAAPCPRLLIPVTTHARPRALQYKATMTRTRACCSGAFLAFARSATARPSCSEYAATEIDAKAIFSCLARTPREKFPARFARGISHLVASRPTVAIARLDSPKTTGPPVKAT